MAVSALHRPLVGVAMTALLSAPVSGQSAAAQPESTSSPAQVAAAIEQLGAFDFDVRAKASQVVRRAAPGQAAAALIRAVDEHADGFVRFRALVLLSALNDPRAHDVMRRAIDDPNDRLREAGYSWFELHPDPALTGTFLERFEKELADFVRPALLRAMAALGTDVRVQQALLKDVFRGQDFFRSAVIEALGDRKAAYAVPALIDVAKLDGPLRDDAVLALGRIGDVRAVETLAALQRVGSRELQPLVAAALCLLGRNCDSHRRFLQQTLTFASKQDGYQALLRNTAIAVGVLAERGDADALGLLLSAAQGAEEPVRAPLALALGRVAVRNPSFVLTAFTALPSLDGPLELLRDAFDMLEEDFAEEQFYAAIRRTYWAAPPDGALRRTASRFVGFLEF
ncbi:MAG: HEAT repeat domain-containing protein [Vicinamibacterales bacterium]